MHPSRSEPQKPLESLLADRRARGRETVSWRPLLFRLCVEDDCSALADLLSCAGEGVEVFDTLTQQLCDLIKTRRPSDKFTSSELESLTRQHLGGVSAEEYGVWVY